MDLTAEIKIELKNILTYWENNAVDKLYGGFVGKRDNENNLIKDAPKGSVLNARILWTFSAAFQHTNNDSHKQLAQRAFDYIKYNFIDSEYGGVYWLINHRGTVVDSKKQIYAIAFTINGLSEYFKISEDKEALDLAISLYKDIEKHAFDPQHNGYFEAFNREWQEIGDLRLSEKDANEKKTMNTHLHILEAYTNLYKIWKNEHLAEQIKGLLSVFETYIIDKNYHLRLFMDEKWQQSHEIISYGHDIEASWLLLEAAEVLEDKDLINEYKNLAVKMADAAAEGLDEDGSLRYEYNVTENHIIKEKHWWVQAEAIVGFLNAWQLTHQNKYKLHVEKVWRFIKKYILDQKHGEWYWGRNEDLSLMADDDKLGIWKCPYHNSRACIEIINRLESRQLS
jgi:mannobiose 2-epimerase